MTIFLCFILPSIISLLLSISYIKLRIGSVFLSDLIFCIVMSLPFLALVNIIVVAFMFMEDWSYGKIGNVRIW
jgi:hypothetical protein